MGWQQMRLSKCITAVNKSTDCTRLSAIKEICNSSTKIHITKCRNAYGKYSKETCILLDDVLCGSDTQAFLWKRCDPFYHNLATTAFILKTAPSVQQFWSYKTTWGKNEPPLHFKQFLRKKGEALLVGSTPQQSIYENAYIPLIVLDLELL